MATEFLNIVNHQFKQIWAIEPDGDNLAQLHQCVDHYSPDVKKKVHILSCALGRGNRPEQFYEGLDFASQLCSFGKKTIDVRTFDTLDISPTFIKVHLEGAEMDAVMGGSATIKKHHPMVALTVYHNRLGIWECPQTLMNEFSGQGYKYYFRLHSWHGTGAVLYLVQDGQKRQRSCDKVTC